MKFLSPVDGLIVNKAADAVLTIKNDSSDNSHHAKLQLYSLRPDGTNYSSSSLYLDNYSTYLSADEALHLQTNGATRLFIHGSGNVGIGTASPSEKLDVVGSIELTQHLKATGGNLSFSAGGNQVLNVDLNGKVYPSSHNAKDLGFNRGLAFRDVYATGFRVGTASTISEHNTTGALRITTQHGYTSIGAENSSWSHFNTDRAQFYFNRPVEIAGSLKPYTSNTYELGSSTKPWIRIYGTTIYQGANRVLATRPDVHTALYSTGGNADDYTQFGIYRNYGEGGPIGGHNTILNVSQTDGNYGFQIGANTTSDVDGLFYRSKNTTFGSGAWQQIASRSWVNAQGYLTAVPSGYATETYVGTQISNLVASAPAALDTLNELAAALGDDPNFATTVTNSIATKLPLAGGTLTGDLRLDGDNKAIFGPNSGYGKNLTIGGNGNNSTANTASIGTTNGNLHIDAAIGNYGTYLNFYDGSRGVAFGNGASTAVAWMGPDGDLWKGSSDNSGQKYWHAGDFANNSSNWNTAHGWGNHASAGYLTSVPAEYLTQTEGDARYVTPIYNGADDNSGKADFAVGTGGYGAVSLRSNQVQIGSDDMNYTGRFDANSSYVSVRTWDRDLLLMTNGDSSGTNIQHIRLSTKPNGGGATERVRIDGAGYTYFHGLQLAISNTNSSHGVPNYFRGDSTHLVIGTGGTLHLNYSGNTTVLHGTNVYPSTNGVANLGTASAYFNRTYTNSLQGGGYTQVNDYSGGSTWYMRSNGRFIFANQHDWTQTFELSLSHNGVANDTFVELGQRTSNEENGRYKGIRIVKRENNTTVNGDLKAGKIQVEANANNAGSQIEFNDNIGGNQRVYLTGYHADGSSHGGGASLHLTSTEPNVTMVSERYHSIQHGTSANWKQAFDWGNHASAGYLTSVPNHSAALITSGTLDGARLPWNSGNDGFTGTYPIVWRAGDLPWTASWLSVNGTLDQLNSKAFGSYVGDTGVILQSYNASASNAEQFKIRHNYGSVDIANPRGNINFETTVIVENTLYVGDSVQHWDDGGTGMYFNTDQVDILTGGSLRLRANNSGVDVTGNLYASSRIKTATYFEAPNTQTRDKIRVWGDAAYAIGMKSGYTFGPLDNDYAMSFQMNNQASRGFWWGNTSHSDAQGAMGLSTQGRLTVATSVRIGYGESDTTVLPSGSLDVNGSAYIQGSVIPLTDRTHTLGLETNRWQIVFCETLDSAGQHESNLQNPEGEKSVGEYATGTVLVWKGGKNIPCTEAADHMRMGIAVNGVDSPLVQGAEPVLVSGPVSEGDYLVTSSIEGHAKAISPQFMRQHGLYDCVIGKALESGEGESYLIKTWINI